MKYFIMIMLVFSFSCSGSKAAKKAPHKKAEKRTMKKFHPSILPHVLKAYNRIIKGKNAKLAKNCLKFNKEFNRAAKVSGYPKAWLMGKAFHESFCNPKSQDWAGGRGLMQITSKPKQAYKKRLAQMLGIREKNVNWRKWNLHNILMGTLFMADYESRMKSRPHGLLAYNMGLGGVRRTLHKMKRSVKARPPIARMMHYLTYNRKMKPRTYVPRVLAAVVIVNRVLKGKKLKRLRKIAPSDIPGWDPMMDPWRKRK